jgi:broad specificity phosphatase PhoE
VQAVIIRHGKVDFQWRKYSTSEQFNKDCKMYDEAPSFSSLLDDFRIDYQDIYISSLQRSMETANQLFGEKDFISTKLIDEVPLCASIASNIKLPLIFWNVSGRLQWLFNICSQKESRKETVYRAEQLIGMIVEKENDCIIVTHGFFMHTLLSQMKKQGFHISHSRLSYSNCECVIAER